MTKKMLIDAAQSEEIRVAVIDGNKVDDFDFESSARKPLRGNIYLARITRVEPSLQAAFVEYGGNRHGFLAFSEIHPDYYQIPVSDREVLQKAEREMAELADELEIFQRGDEEDEDQNQDNGSEASEASSDDDTEDPEQASLEDENEDETSHFEDPDSDSVTDDEHPHSTTLKSAPLEADTPAEISTPANLIDENSADNADHEGVKNDDASEQTNTVDESDAPVDIHSEEPAHTREASGLDSDSENSNATSQDDTQTEDIANEEAPANDDEQSSEVIAKNEKTERQIQHDALLEKYRESRRNHARILRNYKIQEVIKPRQILLIQVVKEERGNKGAALTSYLSLAGRYCVLMPNTARGGGISRKIPNASDRKRLRRIVNDFDVKQGMGLIIRTAGAKRTKVEIKRDFDYLMRLWNTIRELTMKSVAPCLIYEEANLIKRAMRDLYDKEISKVLVEGETGYREAKDFMKMLMPSHAKNVLHYTDETPLFIRHDVEQQLDMMYQPTVRLKSGGYLVIHQTEALIAVDVNSGKATRERNIEATALKTNLEAAKEMSRQCKLRDLAGLIVIDFIDMEENKNNRAVERKLKDAMKSDRARIQIGRISSFGLMEMSRQRRRSGIIDGTTNTCPTCSGSGAVRSHEMAALRILRAIEAAAISGRAGILTAKTSHEVALYVLNHKRDWLTRIEGQYALNIEITADSQKAGDQYDIEKRGTPRALPDRPLAVQPDFMPDLDDNSMRSDAEQQNERTGEGDNEDRPKKRRRRRRKKGGSGEETSENNVTTDSDAQETQYDTEANASDDKDEKPKKRRRRGRRGGRKHREDNQSQDEQQTHQKSDDTSPLQEESSVEEKQAASFDEDNKDQPEEKPKRKRAPRKKVASDQESEPSNNLEESKDEKNTSPSDENQAPPLEGESENEAATKRPSKKRTRKKKSDDDQKNNETHDDGTADERVEKPKRKRAPRKRTVKKASEQKLKEGEPAQGSVEASSEETETAASQKAPSQSTETEKTTQDTPKKKSPRKGWWQKALGG